MPLLNRRLSGSGMKLFAHLKVAFHLTDISG